MNPRNFFAELKRRNVYKVAVAYAVVGWLVMQMRRRSSPLYICLMRDHDRDRLAGDSDFRSRSCWRGRLR